MKDRLTLAFLLIGLWIFLIVFQKYTPIDCSIVILLGFMVAYTVYMNAALKHKRRKIRKNPPAINPDFKPFVSIMIPCHNEEYVIKDTVLNVLNLDYENFEIIVIDDRSTDNTPNVIKELSAQNPKVTCLIRDKEAIPGKSAVLNDAGKIAKGEVFCIFDADARINPDFLNKILPALEPDDVGAAQSRKSIINKNFNLLTRCQHNEYTLDGHFQDGRDSIKGAVELRGNGMVLKRQAIESVGGWNDNTITDDLDMSTRLHLKKWDVRYCHDTEVYEEGIISFMPLLRQRRRWVEGSIRRYLDYFTEVLFSEDLSLRVSFDMWAYISEFLLPVWLISEWSIQGFKLIKGYDQHILSSILVLVGVCVFFISGLIYSLRKYNKLTLWQAIKQSIETGVYIVTIWTPLVFFIFLKIIFTERNMDWGKTVHGVSEIPKLQSN